MAAITIIGTGNMAQGIARVALRGGYEVIFHSREAGADRLAELRALTEDAAQRVSAVAHGSDVSTELVVLAVPYANAEEVVTVYGEKLDGKALVDISNPIVWSELRLIVPPAGSAAEQVAQLAPHARVVKAFNTINASLFASGRAGGLPLDVFIAGDDDAAKGLLIDLVNAGGLRGVDSGPLVHARELEALEHLFVHMKGVGDNAAIKIVPGEVAS